MSAFETLRKAHKAYEDSGETPPFHKFASAILELDDRLKALENKACDPDRV